MSEFGGSVEELEAEQRRIAPLAPMAWRPPATDGALTVGGCFVAFVRGEAGPGRPGDRAWAGAAVVSTRNLACLAEAAVPGTAGASYAPGLLALREGPLLAGAVRALPRRPDVLLVDATGRDHPRRAGLAVHLGVVLDLPTIGVTHRPLLASGEEPGPGRGDSTPLLLDGEEVGRWLRTRAGARPLAVHAAWRTDANVATRIALAVSGRRARTPEPLREARRVARTARADHTGDP